MSRYERQIPLIGKEGQRKLKESSVAIVGCGGLGTTVATMLAEAGVGHLILVDKDVPCESNLNRQFAYRYGDSVGKPQLLAEWVFGLNSEVIVDSYHCDYHDVDFHCDIIVDCLDSVKDRLELCDLSFSLGIPFVHAAVGSFEGQFSVCIPGTTPCLRCMIGYQKEYPGNKPSLGTVVSNIATLEALEVIRLIIGEDSVAKGRLVSVDLMDYRFDLTEFKSDSKCRICNMR